ncbi:MAG: hypothetical protein JXL97_03545 [Bacteroidales bacterium]|nr:hypothetical protein [Bacteroidales bacterium]
MDATTLTAEDRVQIVQIFGELRENLSSYMSDREFKMSNAQLFTFLTYAPVCLAIASDRDVDESEIRLLDKITKDIDVNTMVSLDLMEVIAIATEPGEIMLNEEFNMRVDSELLYLSRNIDKYEENILAAVKALLKIDKDPSAETSLTQTFSKWFEFVVKKNANRNDKLELEKVAKYKEKIGL